MTGEEALAFAASRGVRVTLAFGALRLGAERELPPEVLDALRDHKEAVVAELGRIAAAGEQRRIFEGHVAKVMRVRNLPRLEAERAAFDNLVVERLDASLVDTPPDCCAHCGAAETPSNILLPLGVGARHAWLHSDCWGPWRERRGAEAIAELAAMKIDVMTYDPDPVSEVDEPRDPRSLFDEPSKPAPAASAIRPDGQQACAICGPGLLRLWRQHSWGARGMLGLHGASRGRRSDRQ